MNADVAFRLIQVLTWSLPTGRVYEAALPGWMVGDCAAALEDVPLDELRAAEKRNGFGGEGQHSPVTEWLKAREGV